MVKFTMSGVKVIVSESLKCSSLNPLYLNNFDWIYRVQRHGLYPHPGHYNLVEVVIIAVL